MFVVAAGAYASPAHAAASANKGRLTVSWPGTGFPGYKLVITGRASGSASGAVLVLERRQGRRWRRVAGARKARSGAFTLSWKAPKLVGSISLRVQLVLKARVLSQRSARVRLRPLPVVLAPSSIISAPAPGKPGWIRFRIPARKQAQSRARAASAASCVRIPTGTKVINGNFVAVGYSKAYPDGYLDKINLVQCDGLTGGIYGTPVTLDQAVGSGSLDLSAGFSQVAGRSSTTTVTKSFSQPLGQVTCSGGASATLSGKVGIDVVPTMKVAFSGFSVSSATFKLTGDATASVGIDAKAGATCTTKDPIALVKNYPIATFEGNVGPFPVVVELRGELDLSGSATASVAASDQIDAKATVTGGISYSGGRFSPIKGSRFTITNTGPSVNGTADATATLSPSIQALLYGVAGPQLTLNAGLHLHAPVSAKQCWALDAPVSAQASFDGFGHRSHPYTFYTRDFQLGPATGPCTGAGVAVSITSPGNQTSTVGTPVSLQIQATDTDGGTLTYTATGLPPGLSIAPSTGRITGTPTTPGQVTVKVAAADASGPSNTATFNWTVNPGENSPSATDVAAGYETTCAVVAGGSVECWGDNVFGTLGNGTDDGPSACPGQGPCSLVPVQVNGITNATQVTAGIFDACALLVSHEIECWGYNGYGELGDGTTTGPAMCKGSDPCSPVPTQVSGIDNAAQVAAGSYDVCAVLTDGTVDCWGESNLGNGTTGSSDLPTPVTGITNATQVAVGGVDTCGLLATGHVECWGDNTYGQLGDGSTASSFTPEPVSGITDAVAVASSGAGACALLAGGSIKCWGYNADGGLGTGTDIGPDTCDGESCSTTPVVVAGITTATQLGPDGDNETCAILAGGQVQCWGDNISGQLGNGTTTGPETCAGGEACSATPVDVTALTDTTHVSTGDGPSPCAVASNGTIRCWGYNANGQLGDGGTADSSLPQYVMGIG
jgi:alpha-tubulin suppressor-like RCC1 family protein